MTIGGQPGDHPSAVFPHKPSSLVKISSRHLSRCMSTSPLKKCVHPSDVAGFVVWAGISCMTHKGLLSCTHRCTYTWMPHTGTHATYVFPIKTWQECTRVSKKQRVRGRGVGRERERALCVSKEKDTLGTGVDTFKPSERRRSSLTLLCLGAQVMRCIKTNPMPFRALSLPSC